MTVSTLSIPVSTMRQLVSAEFQCVQLKRSVPKRWRWVGDSWNDIVQDAYLSLLKTLDGRKQPIECKSGRTPSSVARAYVQRALHNKLVDFSRRQARQPSLSCERLQECAARCRSRPLLKMQIAEGLAVLTAEERRMLQGLVDGGSFAAASRLTGFPEWQIRRSMPRIRTRLARFLPTAA